MSDADPGTVIRNRATYRADYPDAGLSNAATITVQGLSILPVTGGLLDPRTPYGRWVWLAAVLLTLGLGATLFWTSRNQE